MARGGRRAGVSRETGSLPTVGAAGRVMGGGHGTAGRAAARPHRGAAAAPVGVVGASGLARRHGEVPLGSGDGEAVESVLIPEGKRRTLCISSQVGCALGCVFCATGRMGFRRNLSAGEIAGQVRELLLRDHALKPTNIVYMGMGEPLLNWDAVDATLTILNRAEGLGIGARHITLSTVGILPNLAKFAKRPEQFRLAVSLHAPTPALRQEAMAVE